MHYRRFAATGQLVSEVGLGTWQLGGTEWGEVGDDDALATLRAAAEAGVTLIDTADIYGGGRSETLIGRFLREQPDRDRFFLATKFGRSPQPGWPANFQPATIREHVEGSLKRLGVDTIDLLQCHCLPMQHLRDGAVWETLRALRSEGKLRAFGASVESMDEALECLAVDGLAALQIIFNPFRLKPAEVLFQPASQRKVALIVRLPLASGLLSGKIDATTRFAPSDHRSFNRNGEKFNVGETFAGVPLEAGIPVVEKLRAMVHGPATLAQWALRWCLDHEEVTTVIPGARSPAQARENAAASDLRSLPSRTHAEVFELYYDHVRDHVRGPY